MKQEKILCIFNIKGGEGKTTTVINLASALAEEDQKVLMVDIDEFASVNRRVGHRGGDARLKAVAGRILDVLGSTSLLARYGPDCFAACLSGVDRAEAEAYSERIVASISERPYVISSGEELAISVSIGGCTTHTDRRVSSLPVEAERALSRARRAGGGRSLVVELLPHPSEEKAAEGDGDSDQSGSGPQ